MSITLLLFSAEKTHSSRSRYHFAGCPLTIRRRADLMASFSGCATRSSFIPWDALAVHRSQDSRIVILEYEVYRKTLASGAPHDNRFISVITIENKNKGEVEEMPIGDSAWPVELTASSTQNPQQKLFQRDQQFPSAPCNKWSSPTIPTMGTPRMKSAALTTPTRSAAAARFRQTK